MRRTSALIIGGGPAGTAAAITLARAGEDALLIERDRETRNALCGGFLSWRTLARLGDLGVDAWALRPHRIERMVVHAGERHAEALLPAPAAGLSRHALDTALIAQAEAAGAAIERGVAVRSCENGQARLADGALLSAGAVILATGKHDVRGHPRPRDAHDPSIGLRWRLGPSAALNRLCASRIELHIFQMGYGGLLLQEDGSANFCITVRRSRLDAAGGDPARLLVDLARESPALAARLDAASTIESTQAVANIPYGWRARETSPGLFRVGDQAGVIPSLAGEGIGIALASGTSAALAIGRGTASLAFQRRLATRLGRPIRAATMLLDAAHSSAAPILLTATARMPGILRLAASLTRF
jgi:flavin-dependent dehydrogenase